MMTTDVTQAHDKIDSDISALKEENNQAHETIKSDMTKMEGRVNERFEAIQTANEDAQAHVSASIEQMDDRMNNRFDSMERSFQSRLNEVEKDSQAGIAMTIATAGLPQAYRPGKSMFAMSAGTYRGETGYALGLSHVTESGNWVVKVTGSGNSQGHFGGSLGAGYQW